ncbi:XRE family transcriptional regulator [Bradyrhizobium nitroreducens]|uniref:XRE family transcriptional regulator n=1 Tax=Bradyrhizobium nitroreducens TaxID=709803 RepID=A0A2M6UBV2_9BRAD|nr:MULTISPECIES: helix-turn-helix domain-containing protein [Bradyrhizobium]PIT02076.1 XRE family transcriptional regulator [Bradyrhizobium nitroreducens]TQF35315.1 XRE family transcriptional regulator [Bradyrhizobium sp. UNPF46]
MDIIARSPQQLGAAIRRHRRMKRLTQGALGDKMHARQATISKLEAGEPATQIRTLTDALAALDLEIIIRPRTKGSAKAIEDLF